MEQWTGADTMESDLSSVSGVLESQGFASTHEEPADLASWTNRSVCPSCRRFIKAQRVVREGYVYVQKYCPFEQRRFESLLAKANQRSVALTPQPDAPRYLMSLGTSQDRVTEAEIANFDSVQNLMLHLTPRCNSTCPVCYDRYLSGRGEMSLDQVRGLVQRLKHKQVYLFGGEPTVRQDLPELIAVVRASGNRPVLYTNGLRLANERYLHELLQAGLETVWVSFDGFREEIYERMRGGRHEYRLKLAALANLECAGVLTVIGTTVARGINDDQIGPLVDYVRDHPFILELSLRPVYLPGVDPEAGMGRFELLSPEEINEAVSRHLGLDVAYYRWWYEAKMAFVAWVRKLVPKACLNVPHPDQVYFRRDHGTLKPLLDLTVLIRLTQALRARRWADPVWLHPTVLQLGWTVLRGGARQIGVEPLMARELGIVRVCQTMCHADDSLSSQRLMAVNYSGKGIMPVTAPG